MPLQPARLITSARGTLNLVPRLPSRTPATTRALSTTPPRASDHAHGDHYDAPGGWLFGVKPGEKYEKEGWENIWYWGFFGTCAFGVVGYWYKPDTRCVFPSLLVVEEGVG